MPFRGGRSDSAVGTAAQTGTALIKPMEKAAIPQRGGVLPGRPGTVRTNHRYVFNGT